MADLTEKQKAFVREYMVDLNATQAAVRAGYSENTAKEIGYENLTKPHIASEIQKAVQERSERTEITADYVLGSLRTVADRCMQGEAITDREGNETGEWRFDSSGANRALELLGKHLKLWTEKVEADIGNKDGKPFEIKGHNLSNLSVEELRNLESILSKTTPAAE